MPIITETQFIKGMAIFATIALSACASNGVPGRVARLSLQQVAAYEDEISRKVKAEQAYYQKVFEAYTGKIEEDQGLREQNLIRRQSQDFAFQQLTDKDSRVFEAELRKSVLTSLEEITRFRTEMDQTLERQVKAHDESTEKMQIQKQLLKKVRKNLEELQKEPSDQKTLESTIKFAIEIQELMKEEK